MSPWSTLWYDGSNPPSSCNKEHRQCYWNDLKTAQEECQKWSKCVYLQQTEKTTPGRPGKPVYYARAGGRVGVESGIVLWKRRGIP